MHLNDSLGKAVRYESTLYMLRYDKIFKPDYLPRGTATKLLIKIRVQFKCFKTIDTWLIDLFLSHNILLKHGNWTDTKNNDSLAPEWIKCFA